MTWSSIVPYLLVFAMLAAPLVALLSRWRVMDPVRWEGEPVASSVVVVPPAPPSPVWSEVEAATVPDAGELLGDSLSLVQGRRYRAAVSLPEGVERSDVEPAMAAIGFSDAHVVGDRDGLVMVEGVWSQPDATHERSELLRHVWLLTEAPPAPLVSSSPVPPVLVSQGIGVGQSIGVTGASKVLREAWSLERPNEPLSPEAEQSLLAVAWHESYFGQGWKAGSPMEGSYNWGAIMSPKRPAADGTCPPGSASQGDSRPTPAGQVKFTACFKVYPGHLEAARDLIRTIYRGHMTAEVMHAGDLDAFALAMRQNFYFGGFCASAGPSKSPPCKGFDDKMAAAQYADALDAATVKIALGLRVARAARRSGSLGPVPSTGADGSAVYAATGVSGQGSFANGGGAAGAGATLLLLLLCGGVYAHNKGWF